MRKIDLNKVDWVEIQKIHDNGVFWAQLPKECGISLTVLKRAVKEGFLEKKKHKVTHSEEMKNKLSEIRKKYLKENPDKHPWRNKDKFKSVPCEKLKEELKKHNIIFIDEFQPSEERMFSIDIAFPNRKVGLEINGNQHYEKTGELKEYYKIRHDFLTNLGWEIYEIHYTMIFVDEFLSGIIDKVKNNSLSKEEFEIYTIRQFELKEKRKYGICICGEKMHKQSNQCTTCARFKRRKVKDRPSKEELKRMIEETSYLAVGRKYGVSDTAIRKWLK